MTRATPNEKFRFTVEPIMCTVFFIIGLTGPLTDLVMRQSCVALNKDPANCTNDESVHKTASTFAMIRIILDTLPGCILTLFTGPWSNTNGRKPLFILALIGLMFSQLILAYLATIPTVHPYWLLLSCVPLFFTGGSITIITIALAYIIDITTNETRTFRLAILNWTSCLVSVLTNFAAASFKTVGYPEGFGIVAIIVIITLTYTVFSLPESIKVDKDKKTNLFTFDHLIVTFKTFFRKRPNNVRGIVWCLAVISSLILLMTVGECEVKYLSVIKKFGWDLREFSIYNAFSNTIIAFGSLGGVYIGSTILKMDELVCISFILTLMMTGSILTVLFAHPMAFWIVTQLRFMYGCLNPFIRGYISKLLPHDEVVNVLSFMGSIDAVMPQIAAITYSNVYNWLVSYDPFAVYNLSALLAGIGILSIIGAITLRWRAVGGDTQESEKDIESSHTCDKKENTTVKN